tara:strand:- start:4349 stop:5353 length:1005 start_codon:yes stop_codon:yes gene_type:complete
MTIGGFFLFIIACSERERPIDKYSVYSNEAQEFIDSIRTLSYSILEEYYLKNEDSLGDKLLLVNSDYLKVLEHNLRTMSDNKNLFYPNWNDFLGFYDTVHLRGEMYFVIQGDMLLTKEDIAQYHLKSLILEQEVFEGRAQKLVGEIRDGDTVKINNPRDLSYAIRKMSFTDEEYILVKENMAQAVRDWQAVCNIKFFHKSEVDTKLDEFSNPREVTFVIEKVNVSGNFIASSFFPYYEKNRRFISVDNSYFSTDYDQVGVFRHEIGHILGFLHEHSHLDAHPDCFERTPVNTIPLGGYDSESVMHYFCPVGNAGSVELLITETDRKMAFLYYPF